MKVYVVHRSENVHCSFKVHLSLAARPWLIQIGTFTLGPDAVPERERGYFYCEVLI